MLSFLICLGFMMSVLMYWGELIFFLGILMFFLLLYSWEGLYCFINNFMYMDYLSISLISLSVWIIYLSIMASQTSFFLKGNKNTYICLMISLLFFLILSFMFSNYLMFYLSFEACLIPILWMILGWGYQPERARAGIYMLFYTMFASLPLFFMILFCEKLFGSLSMLELHETSPQGFIMYICLVMAFLVKFPMYGVHLWLPKAHVEAPVAGSMILAGILLKLGGYGLIRFFTFCFSEMDKLSSLIVILSLWGGVVISIICLRLTDMKLLVAYSSVVHMSTCISGIFILNEWGMKGSILMMVAHGLCSSGLFFIVGLVYNRVGSRSINISKGLINIMPSMTIWWFLLLSSNMAAPMSLNLMGEIMMLISIINWDMMMSLVLSLLCFFSASYSIYLFSVGQHGKFIFSINMFQSGFLSEYLILSLHWIPLNLLIVSSFCII